MEGLSTAAIKRHEAAQELLRRRRARRSLVDFSQAVEIPGAPVSDDPDEWIFKPVESLVAKHHRVMMGAIQNCIETPYGRLMLFLPPGSAKTTYTSVLAPAWAMGNFPGFKVVSTSYAAVPALRSSRRMRQLVQSPAYRAIFNTSLLAGSTAVDEWTLTNDSSILSAGILGGITSSRADLGIIDDPVAGRQEADSATTRRNTRVAYEDDFLTRLKPEASVILMMTRWHLDDLAGSILPEDYDGRSGPVECRDGNTWMVLNIPAKAERSDDPLGRKIGEYLWPEWFGPKHWAIYEGNARTWASLYQQRPTLGSGGKFTRDMFTRYHKTPAGLSFGLASDFAVTKKTLDNHPDYTEHIVFGIDADGDIWLDAGWSGQDSEDVTIDAALDFVDSHKPGDWLMEAGVIKNALSGSINRAMRKREKYMAITNLTTSGDKVAMSASFRALAAAGKVHVKASPWGDALIAQLCDFPFGRYDDKVDACGLIGRHIDNLAEPERDEPVKKSKKRPKPAWVLQAEREDEEAAERRKRYYGQ